MEVDDGMVPGARSVDRSWQDIEGGSIIINYGGIIVSRQYMFKNEKNEETPSHVILTDPLSSILLVNSNE